MKKQSFIFVFSCAPLLIMGTTVAISSRKNRFSENAPSKNIQDTAAAQAISCYIDKARTTSSPKNRVRYLIFATNLIDCISTPEGRESARVQVESARASIKVALPNEGDETSSLS